MMQIGPSDRCNILTKSKLLSIIIDCCDIRWHVYLLFRWIFQHIMSQQLKVKGLNININLLNAKSFIDIQQLSLPIINGYDALISMIAKNKRFKNKCRLRYQSY